MGIEKEQRNKRITKLANKVLYIRDQARHNIKEFEKELYSFAQDSGEMCAAGYVQRKLELGAKIEIDDSLNNLYEYVIRALQVDND